MFCKWGVFFLLLAFGAKLAGTDYYLKVSSNYTYSGSQFSACMLKFYWLDPSGAVLHIDSTTTSGNQDIIHRFSLPGSSKAAGLAAQVLTPAGVICGTYSVGSVIATQNCQGYSFTQIFPSGNCKDFSASNLGVLCLGLELNFILPTNTHSIEYVNGHYSDPLGIYCDPELVNQEPILELKAPCYFNYKHASSKFQWYESASNIGPWKFLDTGKSIYPARVSRQKDNPFFNQKRYYKCITDTVEINECSQCESTVFGPVSFFLGNVKDSFRTNKGTCADTIKNITYYFNTDSAHLTNQGLDLYVWDFTDSSQGERYYLGNFKNKKSISLSGLIGQADSKYPLNPTKGKTLRIKNGVYHIYVDFTPWNGYDCKIIKDTVVVTGPDIYLPSWVDAGKESCPNSNDGWALFSIVNKEPKDSIFYTFDQIKYSYLKNNTISNLSKGNYSVFLINKKGCKRTLPINILNKDSFESMRFADTTLCLGQSWLINAYNPFANSFEVSDKTGVLSTKDTFRFKQGNSHYLKWISKVNCPYYDTVIVTQQATLVNPDFLISSAGILSDSIYAVDNSFPKMDTAFWSFNRTGVKSKIIKKYTLEMQFPDTGIFKVTMRGKYRKCGFTVEKPIRIFNNSDTSNVLVNLGYKGPLIQLFEVNPNPNDGEHFSIKVKLRDTADISIYRIDPTSGNITGDIDLYKKKQYEFTAFKSTISGVYYLKLIAGNESKTIKMVVIN